MDKEKQSLFEHFDSYCAKKPVYYNGTLFEFHGPYTMSSSPYPWTIMRMQLPLESERRRFLIDANPSLAYDGEMANLERNLANGIMNAARIQNTLYKRGVKQVIHFEPLENPIDPYHEDGRPTYIFSNIPHMYKSVFTELRAADLTIESAINIAIDATAIVQRINNLGFVHRNISPTCIYRDENGDIALGDFLFSAHRNDTSAIKPCVDNMYVAPDVLAGGVGTAGSDMYSIALILFAIFTHQEIAKRPNDKIPYPADVPKFIQDAIAIGLTGNPARLNDFMNALRGLEPLCNRIWASPIISLFSSVKMEDEVEREKEELEQAENGMALYPQYENKLEYHSASTKEIRNMGKIASVAIGAAIGLAICVILLIALVAKTLSGQPAQPANVDPMDKGGESSAVSSAIDTPPEREEGQEPIENTDEPSDVDAETLGNSGVLTYAQLEGVPEEHFDKVNQLAKDGILPVNMVGNYGANLSRLDFAILAVNAYESVIEAAIEYDEGTVYSDVPGSDQNQYAVKAVAAGLMTTSTSETEFSPTIDVNRETVARTLAAIHAAANNVTLGDAYTAPPIADNDTLSYWAVRYVQYSLGANLMTLSNDGKFGAQDGVTKLDALLDIYNALTSTVIPEQSTAAAQTATNFALDPPSGMAASAANGTISIQWDAAQGAEGYLIEYSADKNMQKPEKARTESTSVTLEGLKPGTYYVRVKSYAPVGEEQKEGEGKSNYNYSDWTALSQIDLM